MTDQIAKSRGPWIITFTGKHFHYQDPRIEDIDAMDIAVALSREGRYAGHCIDFYSVAQHSVAVSEYMERSVLTFPEAGSDTIYIDSHDKALYGNYIAISVKDIPLDKVKASFGMLGLLHDASEAYMKDLPSPLKSLLPDYKKLEAEVSTVIFKKWGVNFWRSEPHIESLIHRVDKRVFMSEVRDLIKHKEVWEDGWSGYHDLKINPVDPDRACVLFLGRFHELLKRIQG